MPRHLILGTAGHIDHRQDFAFLKRLQGRLMIGCLKRSTGSTISPLACPSSTLADYRLGCRTMPVPRALLSKNMLAAPRGRPGPCSWCGDDS